MSARNSFSGFSVPQYAALGLMAVAVAILGLWFMNWSTSPTWELVVNGLTTDQVATVTDELETAGIDYRLTNAGTAIEVTSNDVADAKVAAGDFGNLGGGAQGYELLDEQGFMASSFRQRVDYQRAIEGELSRTILLMEEVTSATVHLAIPEEALFSEDQSLTRASVVVGGTISQSTVVSITNVVAGAVPGLESANVTVADTSGRILSGADNTGFSRDQQLQMQDVYEAQLEMAAESMLAVALGPGRAVVRVTADLDFDELESETVTYVPDEQVALKESRLDEAFTGDNSVPLGTLGTAEEVTDAGEIAGDDGSAYLRQEVTSEYGVPSTRTVSRQAPGSVDRLTVAVLLDESLEPAPNAASLTPLVAAAVGLDEARGDSIVVETMIFDESTEVTDIAAVAVATSAAGGLDPYLGYAKTGAAVVGMILALLFLRKGLKTLIPASVSEPVEIDPATMAALTEGSVDGAATGTAGATTTQSPAAALGSASVAAASPLAASPMTMQVEASQVAPAGTTIDMLDLIDSQSDEVAHMLRDLVAETVS